MADHAPHKKAAPQPPKFHGWMAEFADEEAMLKAARKVRDAGYTKTDAYTPFPVHGIDEALGIKPTVLPWIVLACGLTGTVTAFTMEIWMNAYDYPYIISGKPFISLPAYVPVGFELTILFSAFSTVIGMLALNGLFRLSNPVFNNPKFDRATDDRFFLFVSSKDKYFNRDSVKELLSSSSPDSLDEVVDDNTPTAIPQAVWLGVVLLVCVALVPVAMLLNIRAGRSEEPRYHVFFDMDFQPSMKAQSKSSIFEDGRASRPQVLGTVARGQLLEVDPYILGYDPEQLAVLSKGDQKFVALQDQADAPADESVATPESATEAPAASDEVVQDESEVVADDDTEAVAGESETESVTEQPPTSETSPAPDAAATPEVGGAVPPATQPALPFLTKLPFEATDERMALGKLKYETYCSACHGFAGDGDGLVAQRAAALAQGYWLPPTSLHDARVAAQPVGETYYTIANGKGKMGSYGPVLSPDERWAIVLYVKALQRSKNAKIDDVPKEQRGSIEGPE